MKALVPDDARRLAALHAMCFSGAEQWSEESFAGLLQQKQVFGLGDGDGFILGRVVADEAEVLTLAVSPPLRRQGRARHLLAEFCEEASRRGAMGIFLEVAADNTSALSLYESADFQRVGQREGYYGPNRTALVLRRESGFQTGLGLFFDANTSSKMESAIPSFRDLLYRSGMKPVSSLSHEDASNRPVSIRLGAMEVRLAESEEEIRAAQDLRWRVFYQEMAAQPTPEMAAEQRDFDRYDEICDHLLVLDGQKVVGTYRMLRRSVAVVNGGHYTAGEFNIKPVLDYPGEILEVGRSCVDADYRTRGTMQLLWQGIAAYVFHYNISLLFGCASLPGTDPARIALPLSYLHYHHLAPPALGVRALPERYVDMRRLEAHQVDPRLGFASLPPLIKGYLRLGGFVGEGAVVDSQFNTTDVCVLVKRETISDRYLKHYERRSGESEI